MDNTPGIVISSYEISEALREGTNGPVTSTWNFNATEGFRIGIIFEILCFTDANDTVQIGDGLVFGEETRLAHFGGTTLPSEVTTISNSAWISIRYFPKEMIPRILMKITAKL